MEAGQFADKVARATEIMGVQNRLLRSSKLSEFACLLVRSSLDTSERVGRVGTLTDSRLIGHVSRLKYPWGANMHHRSGSSLHLFARCLSSQARRAIMRGCIPGTACDAT